MQALVTKGNRELAIIPAMDTLIESFLSAQDVSPSSKKTYGRSLRQFFLWMEQEGISHPTREDIISFKEYLTGEGKSPMTAGSYLVVVRKFFTWLQSEGKYPNIAQDVKNPRKPKGFRKDCLTVAQVKDLLSMHKRFTNHLEGKRTYALLNLLIRTGLRTIELSRANIEDIRQQSGEAVLWIQGKGRTEKDEFVLLTPDTLNPLNDYLQSRGPIKGEDPLFISLSDKNRGGRLTTRSISRIVKNALFMAGLKSPRLTAHSTRHTAITLSLLGGANIQEAQAMARHSSINTTLIYAHNINRVAHAPERKIDSLLSCQ